MVEVVDGGGLEVVVDGLEGGVLPEGRGAVVVVVELERGEDTGGVDGAALEGGGGTMMTDGGGTLTTVVAGRRLRRSRSPRL